MKELQSLDDIFTKRIFRIPDYQRGYAWGEKQLIEFWEDLISLDSNRSHYTGVLSIKLVPEDTWSHWSDEKWLIEGRKYQPFYIVDGQQRLTTVSIFIQCLIEAVRSQSDNKNLKDDEIFLGSYKLSEIVERFIVVVEPKHKITKTYQFGYETDNPSFKFLQHRIFNEPFSETIKETFYTLNLENSKRFFADNIKKLVETDGLPTLENTYSKLTQRFLFNLYEIDDKFDVFVAFETMNNRGKKLSDLELLKNRLIYLTTLYPTKEVDDSTKAAARKNINDAWGEIYNQLGRNKLSPLNDDDFLRAHWIMYFKYSRNTGSDYIKFLLDEHFSPKNVFDKISTSTGKMDKPVETSDIIDGDNDEEESREVSPSRTSRLTIAEINDYVKSLQSASQAWYSTFFPQDSSIFLAEEKLYMDKINRIKIGYFRPLIMAAFLSFSADDQYRLELLKSIERFIFVNFRLCRAQSNHGSSNFYRRTRDVYRNEIGLDKVIREICEYLKWTSDDSGNFKISLFENFISKKFSSSSCEGFYAWNDLRYFLYEYEEDIKLVRGQAKIGWSNFIKNEADKLSIEHIFPQTASNQYWIEHYSRFNDKEKTFLKGSLGNLLPLSSSINSSLQNDSFPEKKEIKQNKDGKTIRNGYKNGSYSELEVAQNENWTAEEIKKRGLHLLAFMERRWDIELGSDEDKLKLLHLPFLNLQQDMDNTQEVTAS